MIYNDLYLYPHSLHHQNYVHLSIFIFFFFVVDRPTPIQGFVDDYCFLIRGLLDLYEADYDQGWVEWASQLQEKMDELLWDGENGGYFSTTDTDSSILLRLKEGKKLFPCTFFQSDLGENNKPWQWTVNAQTFKPIEG